MNATFRTGYLAVIGRPNVGKSTLTNRLVGAKVSITSKKAQTTRHRIHGVLTTGHAQFIFVDTPGFQMTHKNALNRLMNRSVTSTFADVDVILLVVEAGRWGNGEAEILRMLPAGTAGAAGDQQDRPPGRQEGTAALHRQGCRAARLRRTGARSRPKRASAPMNCWLPWRATCRKARRYSTPTTSPTAPSASWLPRSCAKSCSATSGEELPYGIAVEIEKFEQEGELRRIHAAVIVDRAGHRAIVIGKGGERMKRISTDARKEMETLFGGKVWLETWVKVKGGWADDERALKSLGYD